MKNSEQKRDFGAALQALEADYEVLGELRSGDSGDDAKSYIGNRRADEAPVLITVAAAPAGDENNALAHFASDAQLRAGNPNPHVPRVLEARWIGSSMIAVVVERARGTTLREVMSRAGVTPRERPRERPGPGVTGALSNARAAAVLQVVHGVLDWARGLGIVHRTVTPDTLFFVEGTEWPLVSFAIAPLSAEGMPDATTDARTVASLARAMLAGQTGVTSDAPLAELRPDLPARVVEETEAMRNAAPGATHNVPGYIALIATAESIKDGETARQLVATELSDTQRAVQAELAARRQEVERLAAEERERLAQEDATFRKQVADQQRRLEEARVEHERRVAALKNRYADLDKRRVELDKRSAVAGAAGAAEGAAAMEAGAAASGADPWIVRPGTDSGAQPQSHRVAQPIPVSQQAAARSYEPAVTVVQTNSFARRWTVAAVVVGLVLLIGVGVVTVRRRGGGSATSASTPTAFDSAANMAATGGGGLVPDSAGGTVVSPAMPMTPPPPAPFSAQAPGAPGTATSLMPGAPGAGMSPLTQPASPPVSPLQYAPGSSSAADSAKRALARPAPADTAAATVIIRRPRPRPKPVDTSTTSPDTSATSGSGRKPVSVPSDIFAIPRDTSGIGSPATIKTRRDSAAKADSTAKRDTTVKRPPAKRDTTHRDTTARRNPSVS